MYGLLIRQGSPQIYAFLRISPQSYATLIIRAGALPYLCYVIDDERVFKQKYQSKKLKFMAKLVAYSVAEKRNLAKPQEPAKFYAQAQATGTIDVDDMCDRIEEKCTLHGADVVAVFRAIEKEVVDALERGEVVKLGRIGSLQIGIDSRGSDTREAFTSRFIDGVRVNYRPGKHVSDLLVKVEFKKVSRKGYNDIINLEEDETPIVPDDETPIVPET